MLQIFLNHRSRIGVGSSPGEVKIFSRIKLPLHFRGHVTSLPSRGRFEKMAGDLKKKAGDLKRSSVANFVDV